MPNTKTFRLVKTARACENFGAVHQIDTEVLTEVEGGLRVDTHMTGHVEGVRVDRKVSKFYPGVTLDAAVAYRRRNGYTEVA